MNKKIQKKYFLFYLRGEILNSYLVEVLNQRVNLYKWEKSCYNERVIVVKEDLNEESG